MLFYENVELSEFSGIFAEAPIVRIIARNRIIQHRWYKLFLQ